MATKIEQFVEQYALALDSRDAQQLSQFCAHPTVFVTDASKRVCTTAKDIEIANGQIVSQLQRGGVVKHVPQIIQSMRLSDEIQFVTIKWRFLDEQEQLLLQCQCSYTLQKSDGDTMRIVVVVLDDEVNILKALNRKAGAQS